MNPKNFEGRRKARIERVKTRIDARAKRNNAQQLETLDARLGVSRGAAKERKRLEPTNVVETVNVTS